LCVEVDNPAHSIGLLTCPPGSVDDYIETIDLVIFPLQNCNPDLVVVAGFISRKAGVVNQVLLLGFPKPVLFRNGIRQMVIGGLLLSQLFFDLLIALLALLTVGFETLALFDNFRLRVRQVCDLLPVLVRAPPRSSAARLRSLFSLPSSAIVAS
jgi:hypothetical protein